MFSKSSQQRGAQQKQRLLFPLLESVAFPPFLSLLQARILQLRTAAKTRSESIPDSNPPSATVNPSSCVLSLDTRTLKNEYALNKSILKFALFLTQVMLNIVSDLTTVLIVMMLGDLSPPGNFVPVS